MYSSMRVLENNSTLKIAFCALSMMILASAKGNAVASYSEEKVNFALRFKNEVVRYRVMGVFVLPGEKLKLEALDSSRKNQYEVYDGFEKLKNTAFNRWVWKAPKKTGLYPLKIINREFSAFITLQVFVMVPFNRVKNGYLKGYRIGSYPRASGRALRSYRPPRGFIEVTKRNENTLLTPHFKLKQFVCKQEGNYPKYVVLTERLLLKIEMILEAVNNKGHHTNGFTIMSGYRTPYYNKEIGNVWYSRHLWGDAADIFIDENPKDGEMDDLNGDGKIDRQDAAVLYGIIEEISGERFYSRLFGGLASYKKTESHGPFVHVDARGYRARW